MKVSQLVDWYFKEIGINTLKESAFYNKRRLLDLYVIPYIGHMKIKDVNTARLDELWNILKMSGRVSKSYVLSDKTAVPYGSCKGIARMSGLNPATVYAAFRGGHIGEASAQKIADVLGKRGRYLSLQRLSPRD